LRATASSGPAIPWTAMAALRPVKAEAFFPLTKINVQRRETFPATAGSGRYSSILLENLSRSGPLYPK